MGADDSAAAEARPKFQAFASSARHLAEPRKEKEAPACSLEGRNQFPADLESLHFQDF
jgi:hypothetical protein